MLFGGRYLTFGLAYGVGMPTRPVRDPQLAASGDWRGGRPAGLVSPAAPPSCHRWGIPLSMKSRRWYWQFRRPSSGGNPATKPACQIFIQRYDADVRPRAVARTSR